MTAAPVPLEAPFHLPESADAGPIEADGHGGYSDVSDRYPAFASFAATLGDTSLMPAPAQGGGAAILAKCEWENPAGSIKDRVAYALLAQAVRDHGDRPLSELRILEYSGGNLARSLSQLCRALGISSRLVLSSASPKSLLDDLAANGSLVDLVDRELGFLEVVRTAHAIAAKEPDWTLLYQHRNPANLWCHQRTTGAEIVRQLAGRTPTAWVASIGTGGTLVGVYRALRRSHPTVRLIGVTPQELPYGSARPPNGLPKYAGSGGFGNGIRQPFVTLHDAQVEHHAVSYPRCLEAMAEMYRRTGVRIGSSAAANWLIARRIAAELPRPAVVVTVFPDAGTPEEWERIS
ncbi:PLP-dependent cysteine synthase family protein [Actinacidiphila bryophytorum]|uniref:Cysteine synthase n=1 Tax=Actinacidiphila bryophytorum TaxID=1436133 RepID=A0A9W4H232_9ACTN|nr:pyridoxal-phosphate dependent enzyme [Actinacidiphila bryophytorum]MBM9440152.1 pyridoxal-phosphate dependent enzyme [Actinacidiphila bryophytorum]CAG7644946.1 Cysteine synthase [Actinacidiphila bryophytorum]